MTAHAQRQVVRVCISRDTLVCAAEVVGASEELHAGHSHDQENSEGQTRDIPDRRDALARSIEELGHPRDLLQHKEQAQ